MRSLIVLTCLFSSFSLLAFDGYSRLNIGTSGQMRENPGIMVFADGTTDDRNFEVRDLSVMLSYERLLDDKKSFFFGGEFETSGSASYFYTGAGMNFFLGGNPFAYSKEDPFFGYYGFNIGISSIKIYEFSQSISAVSTGIEPGVHLGASYQLSEQWQLSSELGYAYHYGFSTVSVANNIFKANFFLSRNF